MADTTSLFSLPTSPANGNGQNISMQTMDIENAIGNGNGNGNGNSGVDTATIQRIIGELQKASSTGATSLPSRDMGSSPAEHTNDPYQQHDYVPGQNQSQPQHNRERRRVGFVEDDLTDEDLRHEKETIVHNYEKTQESKEWWDMIFEEYQSPILISSLYFAFQMPIVRTTIFNFVPMLYLNDGTPNAYGHAFTSILFAFIYYIISKALSYF